MSPAHLLELLDYVWAALGVYWVMSAHHSNDVQRGEPNLFRVVRITILITSFMLLLSTWLRIGPLGRRYVSDAPWTQVVGISMTLAGVALTVWARRRLGTNWSDKVEIKVDHELVLSGPYAYVRHPIYSGVLLGIAGTALAIGEWRGILAFGIMLVNYAIKAKKEERVLANRFGDAFRQHQRQTGFLIPHFHVRAH